MPSIIIKLKRVPFYGRKPFSKILRKILERFEEFLFECTTLLVIIVI